MFDIWGNGGQEAATVMVLSCAGSDIWNMVLFLPWYHSQMYQETT